MFERVVSLVLVASTGCSYAFIDRPPRAVRKTDTMPSCTSELTWPVVDAALGVMSVVGGIGIATGAIEPSSTSMDPMGGTMKQPLTAGEKFLAGSAAIVEGLLFAWSAYYGYETTKKCRELRARMPPPMYAPQPYAPPPQPYAPQPGGAQ